MLVLTAPKRENNEEWEKYEQLSIELLNLAIRDRLDIVFELVANGQTEKITRYLDKKYMIRETSSTLLQASSDVHNKKNTKPPIGEFFFQLQYVCTADHWLLTLWGAREQFLSIKGPVFSIYEQNLQFSFACVEPVPSYMSTLNTIFL